MPTRISALHSKVAQICKTNLGFAVRLDQLVDNRDRNFEHSFSNLAIPGYPKLGVTVLNDSLKTTFKYVNGAFYVDSKFEVAAHVLNDSSKIIRTYKLQYEDVEVLVAESPEKNLRLGFFLKSSAAYKYTFVKSEFPEEYEENIKLAGIVDGDGAADVDAYSQLEVAFFVFNADDFISTRLDSLIFPAVKESLQLFRLGSPVLVNIVDDYFVVHSPNYELSKFLCPFGGQSEDEIEINSNGGSELSWAHNYSHALKQVAEANENEEYDASVAFYLPKKTLLDYSFGLLKPSVTISDSDCKNGIFWHFNLTAALKKVEIKFVQASDLVGQIVVQAPLEIYGAAGAGIKVGCIKHEVLGVSCMGTVDPLEITVEAGAAEEKQEVFITSKLSDLSIDLDWRTGFGFPFDQISDWLLDRIMRKVVNRFVGEKVDVYRRVISKISRITDLQKLYLFGIYSDTSDEAFFVGLPLSRG